MNQVQDGRVALLDKPVASAEAALCASANVLGLPPLSWPVEEKEFVLESLPYDGFRK